ncbi:MAG: putative lipopolysaccharide heptosyltransferase III [Nitrospirota bacterium]|nr:putative lipopolysaccharide heptosyltransferase III [Nitrospirota bacterium]
MRPEEWKGWKRVLVIKLRYIGDVLITTPFIRALKENLPHAEISALVPAGTEAVLEGNPGLAQIIPYEKSIGIGNDLRVIQRLRDNKYDVCFDLSDADRSAWLGFFSGARYRFGFEGGGVLRKKNLYTQAIPPPPLRTHQVDRNLYLAESIGMAVGDRSLSLCLSYEELEKGQAILRSAGLVSQQPYVVVHAAARTLFKSWPAERFTVIADRLHSAGYQVVLTGSEKDRAMVRPIADRMAKPAIDLTGKTNLRQLASVIQGARLFVGNDSGPMHIASAVGTPVVALFGPTDWESWYPRGNNDTFFSKEIDCRPCGHANDCDRGEQSCMALITLEEVWEAVLQRLVISAKG